MKNFPFHQGDIRRVFADIIREERITYSKASGSSCDGRSKDSQHSGLVLASWPAVCELHHLFPKSVTHIINKYHPAACGL
jgi:hypothetical protein